MPATKMDVWGDDCDSEARPGSYARYYSFTLDQAGQVEINLTSSVDPYLALRRGEGSDGSVVVENDNVGSRNFNSSINRMLVAGTYTVEVTTLLREANRRLHPVGAAPARDRGLGTADQVGRPQQQRLDQ